MSNGYLGEVRLLTVEFAPAGWLPCDGRRLQMAEHRALYSLIGGAYGGDGRSWFGLPDFRGRAPVEPGTSFGPGQASGQENHTLTMAQMPRHGHVPQAYGKPIAPTAFNSTPSPIKVLAPAVAALQGGDTQPVNLYAKGPPDTKMAPLVTPIVGESRPHENRQPFFVLNFVICVQGRMPPRP